MSSRLGPVFDQFQIALMVADAILLAFIMFVFYAVFRHNYFRRQGPLAI